MVAVTVRADESDRPLESFDPFASGFLEDPYAVYSRYRSLDPVHLRLRASAEGLRSWYLFRYQDISNALKDSRLGREHARALPPEAILPLPEEHRPFREMSSNFMLFRDPPVHTRLRSLVNRAFTPRTVEKRRDHIAAIANDLIDEVASSGRMDLIGDYAFLLPVTVIAEMLGVHQHDRRQFREWASALAAAIDVRTTNDAHVAASEATVGLTAYLRDVFAEHRRRPQDDLISQLIEIQSAEGPEKLSDDEMVSTCILLLIAGHETTTNLIGNGTLALLQNRGQWEALVQDPSGVVTAVEELIRYDSPVQMTFRLAFENLEIGGRQIKRGEQVGFVLGSANRDPAHYDDPKRLDITRKPRIPGSFGFGIHFCLGAGLARAEGQIALETLLRRAPNLQLTTDTPQWRTNIVFRGLESLPVTF